MKDQICTEEIIKMIKKENLKTKSGHAIGKLLDAKCLYKHRISENYVTELLQQIGDKYINKIDENIENYIEEIKEIILELRPSMSYRKMSNYLNTKGYHTLKDKNWNLSNLQHFCRKFEVFT